MKKLTIKIKRDWFVSWILDDFEKHQLIEMLGGNETAEEVALGCAGLIPTNHIANFHEIEPFIDEEHKDWDDDAKTEYGYIYGTQDFNVQWV